MRIVLRAEPAADDPADHVYHGLGFLQDRRQPHLVEPDRLAHRVDVGAPQHVGLGDAALGLDRAVLLGGSAVVALDDVIRLRKSSFDIAFADLAHRFVAEINEVALRRDLDGIGFHRLDRVEHGLPLLQVHLDQGYRFPGGVDVFGSHRHYFLTHIAHFILCQHREIFGKAVAVKRHIFPGDHRFHAGQAPGLAYIYVEDLRRGHG